MRCTVASTRRDDDDVTWREVISERCEEVSTRWEDTSRTRRFPEVSTCREDVRTCREDVSTRWDDVSTRWDDVSTRTDDLSLWWVVSTRGAEGFLPMDEAILRGYRNQEGQKGRGRPHNLRVMLGHTSAPRHRVRNDVVMACYVTAGTGWKSSLQSARTHGHESTKVQADLSGGDALAAAAPPPRHHHGRQGWAEPKPHSRAGSDPRIPYCPATGKESRDFRKLPRQSGPLFGRGGGVRESPLAMATAVAMETDDAGNRLRFQLELEFVQCLANPNYLNFLAQRGYFKDKAFVNYLKYLLYWKEPDYAKYLKYPQCLHMLELLQYEHFRKELVNAQCAKFIDEQQILHWQHYSRKRMRLQQALAEQQQQNNTSGK